MEDISLSSPTLPSSSHPHPVPPFFQAYFPCPWLAKRNANPGEIWKVLSHELAQKIPRRVFKGLNPREPFCTHWISGLGQRSHVLPLALSSGACRAQQCQPPPLLPFFPSHPCPGSCLSSCSGCLPFLHLILQDRCSRPLAFQACKGY